MALRSLLRFLRLEALSGLRLEQAALSVDGWNPSLPRAITAGQVQRLLASGDRRTTVGRRDYAIVLLLGHCAAAGPAGLRGGEVVALTLDDLDWRTGEIMVCGKGRRRARRDRLPLPADVGEALTAYLRRGRPGSATTCRLRSTLVRAIAVLPVG